MRYVHIFTTVATEQRRWHDGCCFVVPSEERCLSHLDKFWTFCGHLDISFHLGRLTSGTSVDLKILSFYMLYISGLHIWKKNLGVPYYDCFEDSCLRYRIACICRLSVRANARCYFGSFSSGCLRTAS